MIAFFYECLKQELLATRSRAEAAEFFRHAALTLEREAQISTDAWIETLERELANALIARAERHTAERMSPDYHGEH